MFTRQRKERILGRHKTPADVRQAESDQSRALSNNVNRVAPHRTRLMLSPPISAREFSTGFVPFSLSK